MSEHTPHDGVGRTGRSNFIARHGLYTDDQQRQAASLASQIRKQHIETIRVSFPDQHGLLRGKALTADAAISAFHDGCSMTSSLLAKDTSNRTVFDVFSPNAGRLQRPEMSGAGDIIMVPDPASFRRLPWLDHTAWMLADIYFSNGQPIPYATRDICKQQLGRLTQNGWQFIGGIELEFHLFTLIDAKRGAEDATMPARAPEVELLTRGYQYLSEVQLDEMEPFLTLLQRHLTAMALPLRSLEIEFGPSQCELTFFPKPGLEMADAVILLRSAVKQIARRHGYLASFMCRPALPNILSCGWHLHQSLVDAETHQNLFMPPPERTVSQELLSETGQYYLGGLLRHAAAGAAFSTPTVNGYKRYQPYALAPDRIAWGQDNKGAMLRVIGGAGDPASRIENRVGEPAANPYLYIAGQIAAGLDGIAQRTDPGAAIDAPYAGNAPALPANLGTAVAALDVSQMYRSAFGDAFVDYFTEIKRAEIRRFEASVTDWEQREYFANF